MEAAGGQEAVWRTVSRHAARALGFYLQLPGVLRAVLLIVPIGIMASLGPRVHVLVAIGFCLCLGAGVALPAMASSGIRSGLDARQWLSGRSLHWLWSGAVLRTGFLLVASVLGAASVLLTLATGSAVTWLAATAALAGPALLLPWMRRIARRQAHDVHAERHAGRWARWLACTVIVAAIAIFGAAGISPSPPSAPPPSASALVAEGLEWRVIVTGAIQHVFGMGPDVFGHGRLMSSVAMLIWEGLVAWTLAWLGLLAGSNGGGMLRRGLGRATDSKVLPVVDRAAVTAGIVALTGIAVVAALIDHKLAAITPEDRLSGHAIRHVEKFQERQYVLGTYARIEEHAGRAQAGEAELRAALAAGIDEGYTGMARNVDVFLDTYYSYTAEFARIGQLLFGDVEAYVARTFEEAMRVGDPFADYAEAVRNVAAAREDFEHGVIEILDAGRVPSGEPGLPRVVLTMPDLSNLVPVLPALPDGGMATATETRLALAGGSGALSALVAKRVADRLAQRAWMGLVLRGLSRMGGPVVAVGADYAMIQVEEYLHRDKFRLELLAAIEEARRRALADLEAGLAQD